MAGSRNQDRTGRKNPNRELYKNRRDKSVHDGDRGRKYGICRKERTMIEGIKKIREAFRKITAGLRKDGTINVHPECESYIKEKLEERERHINKKIEAPGETIIFADGEKVVKLTNIKNVQIQAEAVKGSRIVYGMIEQKMPKVLECEIAISNIKGEARELFRSVHNEGNNRRKMNGQPLKRFIAKQKVRKRKVSDSDTMK